MLADLQVVKVTGAHFGANATIGTLECTKIVISLDVCDPSTLMFTPADASGAFTLSRAVRRLLPLGPKTTDCAPKSCVLVAASLDDINRIAGVAISFDPNKPPVVPKITITPNTKLRDHQLVTVRGTGFSPGTTESIFKCPADQDLSCTSDNQRVATVGIDGTFTASNFALERNFSAYSQDALVHVNCAHAAATCLIVVQGDLFGAAAPVTAPLSFDPTIPPVVATLTSSPSKNLVDLQLIIVKGTGFVPGASVVVAQCAGDSGSCDPSALTLTAGFTGGFSAVTAVHRTISAFDSFVGAVNTDCAKRVGGFAQFQPVQISECSANAVKRSDLSYCDFNTTQGASTTAGGGQPSLAYFVRRTIANNVEGLVNCASKPGACVLIAETGSAGGGIPFGSVQPQPTAIPWLQPAGSTRTRSGPDPRRALKAAPNSTLPGTASTKLTFDS